MIVNHSILYVFSRGVPGLVGFLTIILFTRLLSPESYGEYSLILSASLIVYAFCYQWLAASVLRFSSEFKDSQDYLQSCILRVYLYISALVIGAAFLLSIFLEFRSWDKYLIYGVILILTQSWFLINQDLLRARMLPGYYGFFMSLKSLVALVLGYYFIDMGMGAYGALLGIVFGAFIAVIVPTKNYWSLRFLKLKDRNVDNKIFSYGLPITVSIALSVLVVTVDRFMLAFMIGESATGLYSASQGIAQQTVGIIMLVINLSAYPIIVKTLEEYGEDAARVVLKKNAILLLIVGMPITTIFLVKSVEISELLLGIEFSDMAGELLPWIALGTFFSSFRAHYLDLSFYIKKTRTHIKVVSVIAISNIMLNYYLIPVFGVKGSAYAMMASYALGVIVSYFYSKKVFVLPCLFVDAVKIFLSSFILAVFLLSSTIMDIYDLIITLLIALIIYVISLLIFNPADMWFVVRGRISKLL